MTTLTIAVPTYNRLKWLKLSLACILDQASALPQGDIEVLVSDNASTDDTPQYLAELASRYPLLRVNRNPSNIGGEGNFYLLPRLARGRYLYMVGDDDLLEAGALTRIMTALRAEPDYIVVNYALYDEQIETRLRPRVIPAAVDVALSSVRECAKHVPHLAMGFLSAWVARREFFNQISEQTYRHFAQWGMSLMADRYVGISRFSKGLLLAEPTLRVRRRPESDGLVDHFEYFDWFFRGGAEVLDYAVEHADFPASTARRRRELMLLEVAWKHILVERSKGTFNASRTFKLLKAHYGDLWPFWLLCIPAMYAPGLGNASQFAFGVRNALFRQT